MPSYFMNFLTSLYSGKQLI